MRRYIRLYILLLGELTLFWPLFILINVCLVSKLLGLRIKLRCVTDQLICWEAKALDPALRPGGLHIWNKASGPKMSLSLLFITQDSSLRSSLIYREVFRINWAIFQKFWVPKEKEKKKDSITKQESTQLPPLEQTIPPSIFKTTQKQGALNAG